MNISLCGKMFTILDGAEALTYDRLLERACLQSLPGVAAELQNIRWLLYASRLCGGKSSSITTIQPD